MLGFSLCCFLSFTVWVTPENGIAKRQLRYSSVLTQDSRSLQTVSLLSSPVAPQILCIGPLEPGASSRSIGYPSQGLVEGLNAPSRYAAQRSTALPIDSSVRLL